LEQFCSKEKKTNIFGITIARNKRKSFFFRRKETSEKKKLEKEEINAIRKKIKI